MKRRLIGQQTVDTENFSACSHWMIPSSDVGLRPSLNWLRSNELVPTNIQAV
jgi:hypothetical protein